MEMVRSRGHLLAEQRSLNPVEEPFEPSDQLCLRDTQLGLARRFTGDRNENVVELLAEICEHEGIQV